jgi:hypothetical protein
MSMQQLDDQTEDARRLAADAQGRNGVPDPSDLIAVRVEDADARVKISRHNTKSW